MTYNSQQECTHRQQHKAKHKAKRTRPEKKINHPTKPKNYNRISKIKASRDRSYQYQYGIGYSDIEHEREYYRWEENAIKNLEDYRKECCNFSEKTSVPLGTYRPPVTMSYIKHMEKLLMDRFLPAHMRCPWPEDFYYDDDTFNVYEDKWLMWNGSVALAGAGEPSEAATASLAIGDEEAQEYADFVPDRTRARLCRINPKIAGARFLFAVVHTTDEQDTAAQAQLAFRAGADGVLLCAWPAAVGVMLRKLAEVRAAVGADCFVGVNFMASGEALRAAGLAPGALDACDAVWYDKGVDGGGGDSGGDCGWAGGRV